MIKIIIKIITFDNIVINFNKYLKSQQYIDCVKCKPTMNPIV